MGTSQGKAQATVGAHIFLFACVLPAGVTYVTGQRQKEADAAAGTLRQRETRRAEAALVESIVNSRRTALGLPPATSAAMMRQGASESEDSERQ